jgi:hypothetical protein
LGNEFTLGPMAQATIGVLVKSRGIPAVAPNVSVTIAWLKEHVQTVGL